MQFERRISKWGDSLAVVIPSDLAKYLELNEGEIMIIQDDEGKHGKFISMWKKSG